MGNNATENKVKGKLDQAAGAVREKVGDVTGNDRMEREGREQHAKGDAREALGKGQATVDDAKKKVKDAGADAIEKTRKLGDDAADRARRATENVTHGAKREKEAARR